jgi:xylan 1,4-beta-xylosidase
MLSTTHRSVTSGLRRHLLVWLVAACMVTVTLGVAARGVAAKHVDRITFTNPVFKQDFPDPMVLRVSQHDYYAYGTSTSWERGYFPILHSTDLVHWKYVSDAFKRLPTWSTGDFWAPGVVKHGKTYYMYYTGKRGTHCVAVATASSPKGPFKQRNVIGCGDAGGTGYIDPALFIAKDGKAYLYFSVDDPQHHISVLPMKSDLIHPAGSPQALFGITQDWEHGKNFSTVEGPFLIQHGSLYYLFYSGNDWNGDYSMGYATSSSPTGPFTKYSGNPILRGIQHVHGAGGGSIVQGPDNNYWIVYHGWPGVEGYDKGGIRNMRIDPLTWKGDVVSVTAKS